MKLSEVLVKPILTEKANAQQEKLRMKALVAYASQASESGYATAN